MKRKYTHTPKREAQGGQKGKCAVNGGKERSALPKGKEREKHTRFEVQVLVLIRLYCHEPLSTECGKRETTRVKKI